MEDKSVRKNIGQLNDSIKVMSSSSVAVMSTIVILVLSLVIWLFAGTVTEKAYIKGVVFPAGGTTEVCLPKAGVVRSVFVREGQKVRKGDHIAMVSIGESYSVVSASSGGIVFNSMQDGDVFDAFEPLATIVSEEDNSRSMMLLAFADIENVRDITRGQDVQIWPDNEDKDEVGYVRGKVTGISRMPIDKSQATRLVRIPEYMDTLIPDNVISYRVDIRIGESATMPGTPDWTFSSGDHPDMSMGTLCDAIVITRKYTIFEYLFLKAKVSRNRVKSWIE